MKILASTGIRSEYDILYPVISDLLKNRHNVELVVSGVHLSYTKFYLTLKDMISAIFIL